MSTNIRLISRLDIKGKNLIKGINLEGLRVIGDPNEFALRYYNQNVDEIIYMDSVASLYGRNKLTNLVTSTAKNIFVPLTVGGGIRNVADVDELLRAGADKIAINTAAVLRPSLIKEISYEFGSQCLVLSIEAKKNSNNSWEVYTNCGRDKTGIDVLEWAKKSEELGAGEILITSIDQEGTKKGFDINLIKTVSSNVDLPVIASGGFGKVQDLVDAVKVGQANAVAIASSIHYGELSLIDIRKESIHKGIKLRKI